MSETADWNEWRGSWQARGPAAAELETAIERFRRADRRAGMLRVIELTIVVLAVVFPLAAMRHAANILETVLGLGVVVIVVGVAAFRARSRRTERLALGSSVGEFDNAVRSLRYAEIRFAWFLWLVLGIEGAFAAMWWSGGMEVHHDALAPIAVGLLWVPLLVLAATLVWSIRLHAEAKRELDVMSAWARVDREVDAATGE